MLLVGRNWGSEEYRFGFNGKENTDDIYGDDNAVDFGARIYDSRLGRWLSKDPYERKYASFSPYSFVANSPIIAIDPNGKEIILHYYDKKGFAQNFIFNPNEKYAGDVSQIKMFYDMYEYLQSKDAADVITDLATDNSVTLGIFIKWGEKTTADANESYGEENKNLGDIVWNPTEGWGFKDENKHYKRLSPATVLLHELFHLGNLRDFGVVGMYIRTHSKNAKFDNDEEQYLSDEENKVAEKLGEGIRHHHGGWPIFGMLSPVSLTTKDEANAQAKDALKRQKKEEKKQRKNQN